MYECYDKLYIFYKRNYKHLKKVSLALNLTSEGLTALGTVLAPFTSLTLTLSGFGVLIQSYLTNSSIQKRVEACGFAYKCYKKIVTQIRSFLKVVKYDNEVLQSEVKIIDYLVTDSCAPPHLYSHGSLSPPLYNY